MTRHDEQAELLLTRRAEANDVPIEMVRRQKSSGAALALACQSSGLEDKEIYASIGLDAGYFSRIKKGEATLQADLVRNFCEIVGNRIYPEWLAYQVGCQLVQIQSEAERLLEREITRREEAEKKLAYAESLIRGKALA